MKISSFNHYKYYILFSLKTNSDSLVLCRSCTRFKVKINIKKSLSFSILQLQRFPVNGPFMESAIGYKGVFLLNAPFLLPFPSEPLNTGRNSNYWKSGVGFVELNKEWARGLQDGRPLVDKKKKHYKKIFIVSRSGDFFESWRLKNEIYLF